MGGIDEADPQRPFVRHPGPQGGQGCGGGQLVEAGEHGRAQPSPPAVVGKVEGGVEDVFGCGGHQR